MRYEPRPNTGQLYVNEEKRPPQERKNAAGETFMAHDSDLNGSALVDGKEYYVDAYERMSRGNKKYYALKFKPKGERKPVVSSSKQPAAEPFVDDELPPY